MLKIGDFSQLAQVSVRTLRYYDEMGLLKPAQTDRFTDYRYYSLEQLGRLNRILALKELGFSLEQVARLVHDNVPPAQLRGMLVLKQAELAREVEDSQRRMARVEARLRQIEGEATPSPYEVVLKEAPAQTIAGVRRIIPTLADMEHRCALVFAHLYDWLAEQPFRTPPPELVLYHNREYTEQNIDMEAAVVLDKAALHALVPRAGELRVASLPGATLASTVHHGRIEAVTDAIIALFAWCDVNGYAGDGALRELHLFGREGDV